MAVMSQLEELLEEAKVKYEVLQHPARYTAMEIAGAQHIPGDSMAKSVILRWDDDQYCMAVLPATHLIDFDKMSEILDADEIELATEDEIQDLFPECPCGSEPPFGNWHNLPVYVDRVLSENKTITFNAGSFTDTVRMNWNDYEDLVQPKLRSFSQHV
ncbi:MAG: deacylase [Waddliaceae bacterium]|nr:deacylase [Waddliaceae bacterium]